MESRTGSGDAEIPRDVAFVGSLYERNSYDKIKNRLPEYLRGYFDAVMEAQLNISGANIVEPMLTTNILEQLQEYFQLENPRDLFGSGADFQTTVLGFKIAEIERRRALIELSKHYKSMSTATVMSVICCGFSIAGQWTTGVRCRRSSACRRSI